MEIYAEVPNEEKAVNLLLYHSLPIVKLVTETTSMYLVIIMNILKMKKDGWKFTSRYSVS